MVNTTFNSMLSNMKANVGNYLVTETKEKSYTLFKNLFFINFLITGFTSVATFTLASEFTNSGWEKNMSGQSGYLQCLYLICFQDIFWRQQEFL